LSQWAIPNKETFVMDNEFYPRDAGASRLSGDTGDTGDTVDKCSAYVVVWRESVLFAYDCDGPCLSRQ
jgi:hypothetical protein